MTEPEVRITRGQHALYLAAGALTYLLVCSGGIVCVTGSGDGCPDWPTCYGQLVPPARAESVIEWSHRLTTGITTLVVVAAAVLAWVRHRWLRWLSVPLGITLPAFVAVGAFGAIAVLWGLPRGWATVDLGTAMLSLGLVTTAATVARVHHVRPGAPACPRLGGPVARWSLAAAAALYLLVVTGVLAADSGSTVRCLGWPLFGGTEIPEHGLRAALQVARMPLAALAGVLIVVAALRARRASWDRAANRLAGGVLLGLLALVVVLSGLDLILGHSMPILVPNVYAGAALWVALVALAVRGGLLEGGTEAADL